MKERTIDILIHKQDLFESQLLALSHTRSHILSQSFIKIKSKRK